MAHKLSHKFFNLDYSNYEDVLKLSRELKIDFICPGANDFAALSAAYVAETLSLPGNDSLSLSKIIHHKD